MSEYLSLERGLLESLQDGNRDAVLRLLGEGFELRSAVDADETSAADWLQAELRRNGEVANVRNLSVREIKDIAVVSFLLDRHPAGKKKGVGTTLYVVDIWRQAPHQLLARYVSKPSHPPPIPSRPTGRE